VNTFIKQLGSYQTEDYNFKKQHIKLKGKYNAAI